MSTPPPPAQGVRLNWENIPLDVRAAIEARLGSPVVRAESQPSGFSPGVAARLSTANQQRFFLKAIGPEPNPDSVAFHRREAVIAAQLPVTTPAPRLLWSFEDENTGWVVLLFEEIAGGEHPAMPWREDELKCILDGLVLLVESLTPSPLSIEIAGTASDQFREHFNGWQRLVDEPANGLDAWSVRHLDQLAKLEASAPAAAAGSTLVHMDVRADNLLLTQDRVWFVDWPHARVGAAWLDLICFAPSVTMQGGPPPEELLARFPLHKKADADAITAALASIAGMFTHRALQPPPPGLPTLRAFQAAQAVVAREWLAERTGWK